MSTLHVECVRDRCMFGDDLQRNNHSVTVVWSRGPCSCIISRDCECSAPAYIVPYTTSLGTWKAQCCILSSCTEFYALAILFRSRDLLYWTRHTWVIALSNLNSLPPPPPKWKFLMAIYDFSGCLVYVAFPMSIYQVDSNSGVNRGMYTV